MSPLPGWLEDLNRMNLLDIGNSMIAIGLIVAIIAAVMLMINSRASRAKAEEPQTEEDEDQPTSAPTLKPFSNPITFTILMVCVSLVGAGIVLSLLGNPFGLPPLVLGILIWWKGEKVHPSDPRTAGLLKVWDTYIDQENGGIVVGGRTLVLPVWPFHLDTDPIDITDKNLEFKMEIITKDRVPLEGKMDCRFVVNLDDAVDFVQAGKWDGIKPLLDGIVTQDTKARAKKLESGDISTDPKKFLSDPMEKELKTLFRQKTFGIKAKQIQSKFDLPREILDAMIAQAREEFDRMAERAETRTNLEIVEMYMKASGKTWSEMWEKFVKARLMRDQRVTRIEGGKGGISNIALTDTSTLGKKSNNKNKKDN